MLPVARFWVQMPAEACGSKSRVQLVALKLGCPWATGVTAGVKLLPSRSGPEGRREA